jgi:hypothetical protein
LGKGEVLVIAEDDRLCAFCAQLVADEVQQICAEDQEALCNDVQIVYGQNARKLSE